MKKSLLTALMASAMLGVSNNAHPVAAAVLRDDEDGEGDALNTKHEVALPRRNGRNYYAAPTVGANYMVYESSRKLSKQDSKALDAAAAKRARKAARLVNLPRPRGDVP